MDLRDARRLVAEARKDPAGMSPAALKREHEKAAKVASALVDELIAAGRGAEKLSQLRTANDPLAIRYMQAHDWESALAAEMAARKKYSGTLKKLPRR